MQAMPGPSDDRRMPGLVGKVPALGNLCVKFSVWGLRTTCNISRATLSASCSRKKGFEVEWLPPPTNRLRGERRGGSIGRRLGRFTPSTIRRASGDENLYFVATRARRH